MASEAEKFSDVSHVSRGQNWSPINILNSRFQKSDIFSVLIFNFRSGGQCPLSGQSPPPSVQFQVAEILNLSNSYIALNCLPRLYL